MRIRVYGSAQALYCVANTLYWKSFKRQIFTHLTVLKHQNTKTSLYELSKKYWVFVLFEIFVLVRKILQSTVFNDHPVEAKGVRFTSEMTLDALFASVIHFTTIERLKKLCRTSCWYDPGRVVRMSSAILG